MLHNMDLGSPDASTLTMSSEPQFTEASDERSTDVQELETVDSPEFRDRLLVSREQRVRVTVKELYCVPILCASPFMNTSKLLRHYSWGFYLPDAGG